MNQRPLEGVRILDLTTVVVGPACTARLAQYGADIIKIEAPDGDLMRMLGGASPSGGNSGTYLHLNRGKKSVCLDLKKDGAVEIVFRLLKRCDVLVSNLRLPALEKFGLDAASLRKLYPRLIHCLITGYGPGGPYRGKPAYDSVVQGVSGIAGLFLARDGAPHYVPLLIADHVVGEIAAGAVLAALMKRERKGKVSAIEVPMFETMAAFVLQEHLGRSSFVPPLGEPGDLRLLAPSNRPVRTSDGWISVTSNTDAQVRAFLKVIGLEELLSDPRFSSIDARVRHAKEWFAIRDAALAKRTTAEWLRDMHAADLPAMQAHTLETLLDDPHLGAVSLLFDEDHPAEGSTKAINPTIYFDGKHLAPPSTPDSIGASSLAVLEELGFTSAEIEELQEKGVVHGPSVSPSASRRSPA